MWFLLSLSCQRGLKEEDQEAPITLKKSDPSTAHESQTIEEQRLPMDSLLASFNQDCLVQEPFRHWLDALGRKEQGRLRASNQPPKGWEEHWKAPTMVEFSTYYLFSIEALTVSYLNYRVKSLTYILEKETQKREVEITLAASSKKIDRTSFAPAMEITVLDHGITLSCRGIEP